MKKLISFWLKNISFIKDVGTLVIGVLISQIIMLTTTPIITRIYNPELFGVFGVVLSLISILGLIVTLRAEVMIPVVGTRKEANALTVFICIWATISCAILQLILWLTGQQIAHSLGQSQSFLYSLYYIPALCWCVAVYSAFRYLKLRRAEYKIVAGGQIVRATINTIVTIAAGLSATFKSIGLLLGQGAGDLTFAGVVSPLRKRERIGLLRISFSDVKNVLNVERGMLSTIFGTQVLASIYQRIPIFLIAIVYGAAPAGYFALAERLIAAPVALLAVPIGDVYRQRAAEAFRAKGSFKKEFLQVLSLTAGLATVPFAIAIIAAPYAIGPVLGEQWQAASPTIVIMLIGAYLGFVIQPLDKGGVVVKARTYIAYYHLWRFGLEGIAAYLAWIGNLDFLEYLWCLTAARAVTYLYMLAMEYRFASGQYAGSRDRLE